MRKIDITVEITKGFDSDEKSLPKNLREILTDRLNDLVETAHKGLFPRKLYKPSTVQFPLNVKKEDSSLYMFKATSTLSVVLAFDKDPIFHQKIITLYRVVSTEIAIEAFNNIAKKIYQ